MITFKPEVFAHHKKEDGTYNIKIRITFKRQSRRLPTTLYCTQSDLTRSMKLKNGELINKATAICNEMRAACSDINIFDLEDKDVDWVVNHIKEALRHETFHLNFFTFAEDYAQWKTPQTRQAYTAAINALKRFAGSDYLDINDISHSMLIDFVKMVDGEKKMIWSKKEQKLVESAQEKIPRGASSRHLMKLQHIFNKAKDKYNDEDAGRILIPKSPFDKIPKYFPPANGQKNIGQDVMQKVISAQVSDRIMRVALDAFILSFGLMGANLVDMYFAKPVEGEWRYNRQKTRTRRADHAEMRVSIPKEMEEYIERLQEHKGSWWLPTLHWLSEDKDICTARINRALSRWCRNNNIPVFTFYAARHTWASLARKAGVEKALVDECLVHIGDFPITDIYAERSWELMTDANRKVLDMFEW